MRALALSVLIVVLGCDKGAPNKQEVARKQAASETAELVKRAADAKTKVEERERQLDEMDQKLGAIVDSVASAQSDADRAATRAQLEQARQQQAELRKQLAGMIYDELDKRIAVARNRTLVAKDDNERAAAQADLQKLEQDKATREAEDAARRERLKGTDTNPECLNNPLAKGCM